MKKHWVVGITLIFLIFLIIFIFFLNLFLKDNLNNTFTYTKAICDEYNNCQDYLITCENNKVINSEPFTGAVIRHDKDWNDPRNKYEDLCNK